VRAGQPLELEVPYEGVLALEGEDGQMRQFWAHYALTPKNRRHMTIIGEEEGKPLFWRPGWPDDDDWPERGKWLPFEVEGYA
jgi:hypothetical protein